MFTVQTKLQNLFNFFFVVFRCTAFSYLDEDPDLAFFGVYDGHGGTGVANYLKDHLHRFILEQSEYREGNMEEAILKAFLQVSTYLGHCFASGDPKANVPQPHAINMHTLSTP